MGRQWHCIDCGAHFDPGDSEAGNVACPQCGVKVYPPTGSEPLVDAGRDNESEIRLRPPLLRREEAVPHVVFGVSDDSGPSPDETSILEPEFLAAAQLDGELIDEDAEEKPDAELLALFGGPPAEPSREYISSGSGTGELAPLMELSPSPDQEPDGVAESVAGATEEQTDTDPLDEEQTFKLRLPDAPDPETDPASGDDEDLLALMASIGDGTLVEELSDELESDMVLPESGGDDAPPPDETTDVPVSFFASSKLRKVVPLALGCLIVLVILLMLLAVPGWFLLQKYIKNQVQAEIENLEPPEAAAASARIAPDAVSVAPDGVLPRPPTPVDVFASENVTGDMVRTEADALAALGIHLSAGEVAEADPQGATEKSPTRPGPDRLRTMVAFPLQFPRSSNRRWVYRELLLDATDLIHGAENNLDSLVVEYCRAALAACAEYISLDICNEEAIGHCRRFVSDLCSVEDAAAAVLDDDTSRQSLSEFVELLLVEFSEQRIANCRLSAIALNALGYASGWERLGTRMIETVNDLLTVSTGVPTGTEPFLDDAVNTARKLVTHLTESPQLATILYAFATHLHKADRCLDAVELIKAMEAMVDSDTWKTRLRRKRRIWDPDQARNDSILLRRIVNETYQERLPAAVAGIDQQLIARDLGLRWPVKAPTGSPAQIEAQVQEFAEAVAEEAFPLITLKQMEKEATDRFQPFLVGNEVTLRLVKGGPGGSTVKGRFRERYPNKVKIAFRMLRTADIVEEDRIRLFPEACAARRRELIEEGERAFNTQRRKLRQKAAEEESARRYRESGYILRGGTWCSPVALLDGEVNKRNRDISSTLRAAVEKEIYEREGFIRTSGDWQPVDPDIDPGE